MPEAFARNTLLGFISAATTAVGGFVGTSIATRLLGPEGTGVVAYATWCVIVAATIADLGLGLTLQRFIPNLHAEGKQAEAEGLIGATARLSMLATIVGSLLLVGWLCWPGRSAMEAPSQAPRIVLIVLVMAWLITWRMADLYLAYLKGEQQFGEFARLSVLTALIKLVVIVLGAWLFGVAGALAAYVTACLFPAFLNGRLLRKKPTVDQELRRHVMRFALTGWTTGVIGSLVWGRSEIVFLEHYAGISAVGIFAAAATLADMVMQLPPLVLSALLPYFSEQQGLGAHEQIHRLYRAMTGILALLVVPSSIGIAAIAPVLVPLLFGAEFAAAVPVATVLLMAAAISSIGTTTTYLILSTGKIAAGLVANAFGLAGTIVFGFLVIPHFGLMGAAWSRAVVQVLVVAIETWYVTRRLDFAPPYRALGAITLAAVIPGAVANVLITRVGGIISLVLAIPAAVVVFVVVLRALRVLPMVDPALVDTAIAHAPGRMRPVLSWLLRLVSPATKGRLAPD